MRYVRGHQVARVVYASTYDWQAEVVVVALGCGRGVRLGVVKVRVGQGCVSGERSV